MIEPHEIMHVVKCPDTAEEKTMVSCFTCVDHWDDKWQRCPICDAVPDDYGVITHKGPLEIKAQDLLL